MTAWLLFLAGVLTGVALGLGLIEGAARIAYERQERRRLEALGRERDVMEARQLMGLQFGRDGGQMGVSNG